MTLWQDGLQVPLDRSRGQKSIFRIGPEKSVKEKQHNVTTPRHGPTTKDGSAERPKAAKDRQGKGRDWPGHCCALWGDTGDGETRQAERRSIWSLEWRGPQHNTEKARTGPGNRAARYYPPGTLTSRSSEKQKRLTRKQKKKVSLDVARFPIEQGRQATGLHTDGKECLDRYLPADKDTTYLQTIRWSYR